MNDVKELQQSNEDWAKSKKEMENWRIRKILIKNRDWKRIIKIDFLLSQSQEVENLHQLWNYVKSFRKCPITSGTEKVGHL